MNGMKVVKKTERAYQKAFLNDYHGWAEGFHPALGSQTGIPDTMFLKNGVLIPIELKIGEFVKGKLVVNDIRPAQIRWAKKFKLFGGKSGFVCGVPLLNDFWATFLLPFDKVVSAENPFDLDDCCHIPNYDFLFDKILGVSKL
jgi:hypothetical protein